MTLNIEPIPAKVIRADDFKITANTPCRLDIILPIKLPAVIDPSIPAPPYLKAPNLIDRLRPQTMPIWRAILAGLLHEMFGSQTNVWNFLPPKNEHGFREDWVSKEITNPSENFNLDTGFWRDQYGTTGNGIEAFLNFDDVVSVVLGYRFRIDVNISGRDKNPLVVELRAMDTVEDEKVVFTARKYGEHQQLRFNQEISTNEGWP